MEEPWEALDVDDSDISSLLRPCKRLHHRENPISTDINFASLSEPFLRPCSRHSSPTLADEAPQERRLIPGPAGAVQSAMLQKARDREKDNFLGSQSCHSNPESTQEYIRRAVENAPEFDGDFSSTHWLSALQFIGTVDGVVPSVPLSSMNQCLNGGKVDRVVAVIKSCTHSILGGLMVTLKDPTGTVGAYVHHKGLSESQFAHDFAVGSVLVLEKVAIFSPSKSVHYINIMARNLVKVFKKDNGPLPERHIHVHTVKYIAPGEGCSRKVGSPEKMFIPETGTCAEIVDGMQQPIDWRGRLDGNLLSQNEDLLPQSSSSRCRLKDSIADKEPLIMRPDTENGLFEESLPEKAGANFSHANDRGPKAGNPKEKPLSDDATERTMMNHDEEIQERTMTNHDEEIQGSSRIQKRKKLFTESLPLWTDEQLEELFAGHDEDDSSFF